MPAAYIPRVQAYLTVRLSAPVTAAALVQALGPHGGAVPAHVGSTADWVLGPLDADEAVFIAVILQQKSVPGPAANSEATRPYGSRACITDIYPIASGLIAGLDRGEIHASEEIYEAVEKGPAGMAFEWRKRGRKMWECLYADATALLNAPFDEMFAAEMECWVGPRKGLAQPPRVPSVANGLFGIALSGGGQRAAVFSLGVCQALSRYGLLQRADYLSTVSGGGYFGASLQALATEPVPYVDVPEVGGSRRFGASPANFPFRFPRDPEVGEPGTLPVHGLESPAMFHVRKYANLLGNGIGLLDPTTWATFNRWLGSMLCSWLFFLLPIPLLVICGLVWVWAEWGGDWFTNMATGVTLEDGILRRTEHREADWARVVLPALGGIVAGAVLGTFLRRWTDRKWMRVPTLALGLCALLYLLYPAVAGAVWLLDDNTVRADTFKWIGGVTAGLSTAATALGLSSLMRSSSPGKEPAWLKAMTLIGGYIFLLTIVILLSWAAWHAEANGYPGVPKGHESLIWIVSASGAILLPHLFIWNRLAGRLLNALSIHGVYEERIGQTWVIAGNDNTGARPWTESYPWVKAWKRPDMLLKDLGGVAKGALPTTPYPLFCSAINIPGSKGDKLPERKGDSFVLAPLWSGSASTRWFPMNGSAEKVYREMTVASAAATSGAAFTSNMGEKGNRTLSILFTVFNVRIGKWCTRPKGGSRLPRTALQLYVKELLSIPRRDDHQVYLSDGGHFENLGLYELVRRRCKYIIAVTADTEGAVGTFDKHGNLGTAARYVREDFGVQLHMHGLTALERNDKGEVQSWFALGEVRYPSGLGASGLPEWESGVIAVIKTGMISAEASVDLINHWRKNRMFPYDATVDQQYDQAQFEAYRQLGYLAGRAVGKDIVSGAATVDQQFRAIAGAFATATKTEPVEW